MAIFKVKKRNWTIVDFDISKIQKAIKSAVEAVWGTDFSKISDISNAVVELVEKNLAQTFLM